MIKTPLDHLLQIIVYLILIAVVLSLPRILAWIYVILLEACK